MNSGPNRPRPINLGAGLNALKPIQPRATLKVLAVPPPSQRRTPGQCFGCRTPVILTLANTVTTMSTETLEVTKREKTGSLAARKLRQTGHVPAILYGHGEENVNLSVRSDVLGRIVHHGTKLLSLKGAVTETALLRDVQWDAFGIDILHVDLTRVSQSEAVEVTVPVELHGEAPGTNEGGTLAFALHELTIKCPASSLPEHITVNIGGLHSGDSIHASDVELPAGVELVTNPTEVVVQVVAPKTGGAGTSDEGGDEAAEPEVISKGKGDEEEAAAES